MSLVDKVTKKGRVASPLLHLTICFFIFAFISALVLSFILKVEIVARGVGKVTPLSRVQVVQPEYAGKIINIDVKNGDLVKKGQVLIEFDKTEIQAELNKVEKEQQRLEIERERIKTLRELLDKNLFVHKKKVSNAIKRFNVTSEYAKKQKSLLMAEIADIQNSVIRIDAQIKSNKKSTQIIQAEVARSQASLKLEKERFMISKKLLNKRTISRASHLEALSAYTNLQKEQEIYRRRIEQTKSNERTLFTEKKSFISGKISFYLQRSNEIESRLSVLAEDLTAIKRRLAGMKLFAPATGIVDQLSVFTVGGITQAGQELMRIVPNDNNLEIEALFTNSDIGFIENNQRVNIKLDAFPSERFGMLKGIVTNVSADAIEEPSKGWGFIVRIKPDTSYLETKVAQYQLRSGMTATIDIVTGKRNLISYFFAPLLKTIQDSMGER